MEQTEKEIELAWQRLMYQLKPRFKRKPNLQSVLFLIGVQELGQLHWEFSKEEKQDLMHIATCRLLREEGLYEFIGFDEEGWPHYERTHKALPQTLKEQELMLKKQALSYIGGGVSKSTTPKPPSL